MKALLIEDDGLWRSKIQIMLDEIGISIVGIATTVIEAIDLLKKNNIDIIVADIMLEHETVFKVFEFDRTFCDIPTVLVTQSDKEIHFKQAKLLSRSIYIVKPIHRLTLKSAIDNVKKKFLGSNETKINRKVICIKGKHNEKIELPIDMIHYIEQQANYCHIITKTKVFVLKKSLTNIMLELDDNFLQIHRTYCVNTSHVEKYAMGLQYVKIMGVELPVGRVLKNEVKKYLAQKFTNQELSS